MEFFAGDRRTLERFRAGERAVLGEVYDHYVDEVARVLRAGFQVQTPEGPMHVPGLDSPYDVECGTHDVFLRAFSEDARCAYDGVRPYRNYLFRIARNWRIDRFRRGRREVVMEALPEPAAESVVHDETVDRELAGLLERFVGSLPPRERQYYEARYYHGRSQTEAAEAQGMTRIQGRRIEAAIKQDLLRFLRSHGYGGST